MKKTLLFRLVWCLAVLIPLAAQAWTGDVTIQNDRDFPIGVIFLFYQGCDPKAFGSTVGAKSKVETTFDFGKGCKLYAAQIHKNSASGPIIYEGFQAQFMDECPAGYIPHKVSVSIVNMGSGLPDYRCISRIECKQKPLFWNE
jgi:hypothetical protein